MPAESRAGFVYEGVTLTGRNSASCFHLKGDTMVFMSESELSLGPFCRGFCCGRVAFV